MRFGLAASFMFVGMVAITVVWSFSDSYTYVHTRRPRDITVIGNGWLYGTALETNNRAFFKSCSLSVNELGDLIGTVGGKRIQIEPHITVPVSIEQLRCSSDGKFTIDDNSLLVSIGCIDLALASTSATTFMFGDEDLISPPHMKLADSTTGFIQTGWLLQQESLTDRLKKVSFGELAILIVACGILIHIFRLNYTRRTPETAQTVRPNYQSRPDLNRSK